MFLGVLHRQAQLQAQLGLACPALSRQLGDGPYKQTPPHQLIQNWTAESKPETRPEPMTLGLLQLQG